MEELLTREAKSYEVIFQWMREVTVCGATTAMTHQRRDTDDTGKEERAEGASCQTHERTENSAQERGRITKGQS